jgi:hypothetical protein
MAVNLCECTQNFPIFQRFAGKIGSILLIQLLFNLIAVDSGVSFIVYTSCDVFV